MAPVQPRPQGRVRTLVRRGLTAKNCQCGSNAQPREGAHSVQDAEVDLGDLQGPRARTEKGIGQRERDVQAHRPGAEGVEDESGDAAVPPGHSATPGRKRVETGGENVGGCLNGGRRRGKRGPGMVHARRDRWCKTGTDEG